ncbi:MAG: NUDIX domain-containing protein, partial [Bacteroidota bacterium]|nr:NUDIX domain-containing protein [Bacteroidota bacterium]
YYLKKRTENDIWQGLYDFYFLPEGETSLVLKTIKQAIINLDPSIDYKFIIEPTKTYKRILSHQKIMAKFYLIQLNFRLREENLALTGLAAYSKDEIEQLPKPVLISQYLQDTGF